MTVHPELLEMLACPEANFQPDRAVLPGPRRSEKRAEVQRLFRRRQLDRDLRQQGFEQPAGPGAQRPAGLAAIERAPRPVRGARLSR